MVNSKWSHLFEDDEVDEKPIPKKTHNRGRPAGARNRTADEKLMESKVKALYKRVEPYMDDETKAYYEAVLKGKVKFDALKEAQMLIRYMSIYTTAVLETELRSDDEGAFKQVKASQDVAKVLAEYRMGIKDIEDMTRKREEMKMKSGENEQMVDPTRKSEMALFSRIHGDDSA